MKDDELLDRIARAARDAQADDPLDLRWDDVPTGKLSDEEIARLVGGIDNEQMAERADAAFAPVDDAFRAQLADAATAAFATTTATTPENVVALPTRSRSTTPWVVGIAASLTLALGVTLSTSLREPGATLPTYTHVLRGTSEARNPLTSAERVRRDQDFELLLTPATAIDGTPQVALYHVAGDALQPLELSSMDVADSGAVRLTAKASQLPVGPQTLYAVVANGKMPAVKDILADDLSEQSRRLTIELIVDIPD